jgi:hypothetical protein
MTVPPFTTSDDRCGARVVRAYAVMEEVKVTDALPI